MSELAGETARFYQDVVLRHSRAPLHAHRPGRVDGSGIGDNPMCGDHVEVFVARDAAGAIAEVGFEARGCAISVASADLMAGLVRGAAPGDVRTIEAAFRRMIETGEADDPALDTLRPLSGVHAYPSRRRCATLPWQALLQAIDAQPAGGAS